MKYSYYEKGEKRNFSSPKSELDNCVFVKTILMIIVVLYHSILFWGGSWFVGEPIYEIKAFAWLAKWFNSFHIYGFTFVSGYLFAYLKLEQNRYTNYIGLCLSKIKRLLIPYVFVSVVWAIPFAVVFYKYGIVDIAKKFLLGIGPHQLWFLLMLFAVFIIFAPLSNFFAKRNKLGLCLILVFYAIGVVGQAFLPNVFQIFTSLMYLPLFWLGFKIRQYGSSLLYKVPIVLWFCIDIALFLLSEYLSKLEGAIFTLLNMGISFVLHIVGAIMIFLLLQYIASRIRWKNSRIFSFLSSSSMTVYLLHQQIIYLSIYFLNGINPYLHSALNFIFAILISCVLSFVLMKFKYTRLLMGGK